ncbi:MAG: fibronectin type III domain-containing protein, partial [Bacillota bacterium]
MQFVFKHSTGMTVIAALLLALFYGCDRSVNLNDTEDTMAPAVPQNAAVTWAYDGTVDIDWKPNPELNIKGYNIYRSINDTLHLSLRSFTSNSYFTDDSLSYDSVYYYRVSAVTIRGLESMKTPWLKAQPVNLNPPVTPKFLEINARNWNDSVSVFLKWQPNLEGDIAGYKIYKSENPDFTADTNSFAGFSSAYYFTDKKNLQLYKRYYYRIKAVDKGGLSSQA